MSVPSLVTLSRVRLLRCSRNTRSRTLITSRLEIDPMQSNFEPMRKQVKPGLYPN
jgi:hypothetical protein